MSNIAIRIENLSKLYRIGPCERSKSDATNAIDAIASLVSPVPQTQSTQ